MGVFLCLVLPLIAFVAIMLVCKWGNFSIIPEGLKIKPPKKYRFPKISRGEDYKWEAHYSSEEDDILFGDSDGSDPETSDSSEESSSEESDGSDSEIETVFF